MPIPAECSSIPPVLDRHSGVGLHGVLVSRAGYEGGWEKSPVCIEAAGTSLAAACTSSSILIRLSATFLVLIDIEIKWIRAPVGSVMNMPAVMVVW